MMTYQLGGTTATSPVVIGKGEKGVNGQKGQIIFVACKSLDQTSSAFEGGTGQVGFPGIKGNVGTDGKIGVNGEKGETGAAVVSKRFCLATNAVFGLQVQEDPMEDKVLVTDSPDH